ncbi:DNA-binding transcriptional regulator, IclR family [Prauserella marina]|uniref:DNA-binding transcriptional regulator, IclR family n=1 Tax=Prauserella marina TaxID=530584 RepID=A0A1G6REW7_9PSEU|nr:IclR family transcriptional regulator [Prauserella marina]PWV77045.1 IclR family transcriptional regulator [Prauserella marina]SDD03098.1 DNA-binding transcriptional regulator, IclR family [Prauserella marina]
MTAMHSDPDVVEVGEKTARPSVIERVTQILDVFMMGPERLLLEDITRVTGLPRSTAFRILSQLVGLQWLEHDNRGYRLGTRLHGLGARRHDHGDVRAAAATALNDLHLATGAVAHLAVLEGANVHYLDKIGGAAAASVPSGVGSRVPADAAVTGLAMLACLVPEQVDTLLAISPGSRYREAAVLAKLHRKLGAIRQRHGLAFAPASRCPLGISAVAAPVVGPDGAVGAISVAGKGLRFETVAPMVMFASRRTARTMFPGKARGQGGNTTARPFAAQRSPDAPLWTAKPGR